MTANIAFNPVITTVADGSFNVQSDGLIQGQAMDDPSTRFRLRSGLLADGETIPMWGGVGIYELVPGPGSSGGTARPSPTLGGLVGRANILAGPASKQLTGFSVFDQAHNMINTPQSPVPLAGSRMSVNFYPLGSLARVAVKCDPTLVDLEGTIITSNVSWDFVNQLLVPYAAAYTAKAISAITWAANVASVVSAANTALVTGDFVNISASNVAAYNGYQGPITVVDSTHFTFPLVAASDPGAANTGQVDAGGGALPVKILGVQDGNSMTVDYDAATGFATWDRSGTCAIIQI